MTLTSKEVPINQALVNFDELADEVARSGIPKVLTRDGASPVVLVSVDDHDELLWRRCIERLNPFSKVVEAMREIEAGGGIGVEAFREEVMQLASWVDARGDLGSTKLTIRPR